MYEKLKRDNKKENDELEKNVKWRERIEKYSLRRCCVFKVIILEK